MFDLIPFRRDNNLSKREDYFNQLFSNVFDNNFLSSFNHLNNSFKVDLNETEGSYMVEADLPGIKKESISLSYYNSYLTINAKREDSIEDKKGNYVRRERHYGEFKRSFYVDNVDEEKIDASFKNGVLKVNLPKLNKERPKGKQIDIH